VLHGQRPPSQLPCLAQWQDDTAGGQVHGLLQVQLPKMGVQHVGPLQDNFVEVAHVDGCGSECDLTASIAELSDGK